MANSFFFGGGKIQKKGAAINIMAGSHDRGILTCEVIMKKVNEKVGTITKKNGSPGKHRYGKDSNHSRVESKHAPLGCNQSHGMRVCLGM